jgi:hypothetical protein
VTWARSAAKVFSWIVPRRVVAGQLIRRWRSPGTNWRIPANSSFPRRPHGVLTQPGGELAEDDERIKSGWLRQARHLRQADQQSRLGEPPAVAQDHFQGANGPRPPPLGPEREPVPAVRAGRGGPSHDPRRRVQSELGRGPASYRRRMEISLSCDDSPAPDGQGG